MVPQTLVLYHMACHMGFRTLIGRVLTYGFQSTFEVGKSGLTSCPPAYFGIIDHAILAFSSSRVNWWGVILIVPQRSNVLQSRSGKE